MSGHGKSPRHRRKRAAKAEPATDTPAGPVRVQKLLAAAGLGSRRASEELILQGRVTINGNVASLGDVADPIRDRVALDGEKLTSEKLVYWLVNKPEGVVSTVRDPEGRDTIVRLLPKLTARVYPVGRLDRGTSGLVLLTNDGAMTQKLLHPSLGSEREYKVVVRGELSDKVIRRLERGVHLDEGRTSPCEARRVRHEPSSDTTSFHLTLREGRKRQIRRSLLQLGHPVKKLMRVRMGPIKLGRLARGEARPLRSEELRALREHVAGLKVRPKPTRVRRARPR